MNKQRHSEKVEKKTKGKKEAPAEKGAVPAYLLDREHETQAKNISSMVKQKRIEKDMDTDSTIMKEKERRKP